MYNRKGKRGVSLYSDFYINGKRYKKCWGMVSKSFAKENEGALKKNIRRGDYEGAAKKVLFDNLSEKYLDYSKAHRRPRTHRRYIDFTNKLLPFFKGKHLTMIHPLMIERYKKERLEKVKPATVNRELAYLKAAFNMAIKWKLARENPVREVAFFKEEQIDVTILTYEKEEELYGELKSKKIRAIVTTALNTGMRKREILDLTKDNVDFRKGVIHVTHTKNWEMRDIPMNEKLTKALKEIIDRSPNNPYVFASDKTGKPFVEIKNGFSTAVKRIGLASFRFHDLRHTWCSRMCELKIDETTIMKLGGWKTRSMINRYSHPSMDHMREALESLNKSPEFSPELGKQTHSLKLTTTLNSVNI